MTPVEKYLDHLDNVFQQEPLFFKNNSLQDGVNGVTSIVYKDIPDPGFITALTYGLSLIKHPDWELGRPELCITVESTDMAWGRVVGYIANTLRGDCPFSYGQTINFNAKISDDSDMDAFLIFAPSILEKEDYLDIDIGTGYNINIAGLYPIYSSEIKVYDKIGFEDFWHHPQFDMYDVKRDQVR